MPTSGSFLRPRRARRPVLLGLVAVVGLAALLVVAWGVDTAAGGDVVRNVEVAGTDVGGNERAELDTAIEGYAADLASAPVQHRHSRRPRYDTTARRARTRRRRRGHRRRRPRGRSGLRPAAALPVGGVVRVPPRRRSGTRRSTRRWPHRRSSALEGDARTLPTEPTIALDGDGRVVLVAGVPGSGVLAADVAERLPDAALATPPGEPIVVDVEPSPLPPATPDDDGPGARRRGEPDHRRRPRRDRRGRDRPMSTRRRCGAGSARAGQPTALRPSPSTRTPPSPPSPTASPTSGTRPVDASFAFLDGRPSSSPAPDGTGCCETDSAVRLLDAMHAGTGAVELDGDGARARASRPRRPSRGASSSRWAAARAWPENRTGEVGAGFTTFHAAGEARVTNIHRIADLVRGAVIPPGGSFSVNDYVGRRTVENGFVRGRRHPQRRARRARSAAASRSSPPPCSTPPTSPASTSTSTRPTRSTSPGTRVAARRRWASPTPDLVITNDTPYGVMIWNVVHRGQPHRDDVLDAVRDGRADRHQRGQFRATAPS